MNGEQSSARLLEHFRASKQRLPLHPLEKAVLTAVAIHLCFLPWALGTMHVWSQITSLALSAVGLLIALIPRTYSGDLAPQLSGVFASVSRSENRGQTPGWQQPATASSQHSGPNPQVSGLRSQVSAMRLSAWPRLLRFPIFWIGLALLAYIVVQALNPSWVWERNERTWWLRRVNDIPWLPTSIDTPFERFNIWRQYIIYAAAWLTTCTVWIGFTRRRTLQLLLTIVAINSAIFAVAGFARMIIIPDSNWVLLLNEPLYGATPFATFIYKNHASAYLSLVAGITLMLAAQSHQRAIKTLARSEPTMLWLVLFAVLGFAIFFTYSRGAMIILAGYSIASLSVYLLKRPPAESSPTFKFLGWTILAVIVLGTLGYGARQLNYQRTTLSIVSLLENREKDASVAARLDAYKAGRSMLDDYWLRGVGAGGFRYLFPEYVKNYPAIYKGGQLYWEHLHRDWYQIPIELGLAGCIFLLSGACWVANKLHRNNLWDQPAVLILLLGCLQPLLQAWFDFPLQNPAILCTCLALIILSARWSELDAS